MHVNIQSPQNEPPPRAEQIQAFRDAMLLLTLVARADMEGWRYVVQKYCQVDVLQILNLNYLYDCVIEELCFEVQCDLWPASENERVYHRVLEDLVVEAEPLPPSTPALVDAIQRVLAHSVAGSRLKQEASLDIIVNAIVLIMGASPEDEPDYWSALGRYRRHNGGWRFPMPLLFQEGGAPLECAIVLDLEPAFTGAEITRWLASRTEEIATTSGEMNISSVQFGLGVFECDDQDEVNSAALIQELGRLYERVLCASNCPPEQLPQLDSVKIRCCDQSTEEFTRMISAVANCRRTTKFGLDVEPMDLELDDGTLDVRGAQRMWQSIAYGLFSTYARSNSSITSLELTWDTMTTDDVAAFAEVMASTDPLRKVYGRTNCKTSTPMMLKQGAAVKLVPVNEEEFELFSPESLQWTLATDVSDVMIIRNNKKTSDAIVIIPGYGLCSVARDALIPTSAISLLTTAPITDLSLICKNGDNASVGVPGFLRIIGTPLTYLSLETYTNHLPASAILATCPNLKTLVVKNVTINAHEFIDAYNSSSVNLEDLDGRFDDIVPLMVYMKNPTSRLARTLKGLTFHSANWAPLGKKFAYIRQMLLSNKVLEFLHVLIPRRIQFILKSFLDKVHRKPLPLVRKSLPLKCRLAFLSILYTPDSHLEPQSKRVRVSTNSRGSGFTDATLLLNRDVISLIFAFAAECRLRRVYVDHEPVWSEW